MTQSGMATRKRPPFLVMVLVGGISLFVAILLLSLVPGVLGVLVALGVAVLILIGVLVSATRPIHRNWW